VSMTLIKDSHLEQYRTEGYFILENALPAAMLRNVQDEAMRFKTLFDAKMREAGVEVWDINHLDKRYFISLYHNHSRLLQEYLFSEQMAEICRATVGPEVFLFQEQFVIKGAEVGMTFAWHQDGGWFAPDCPPYVSVWLALDDMTEENGTIYVLPQTRMQKRGWLEHRVDPKTNDRIGYEGPDPGEPVFVPAGSLAVFSHQTLHRSGANTTQKMRRVYLAQYSCAPILNRHYLYSDYTEKGAKPEDVAFFARRFLRNWKVEREDTYPIREPKRIDAPRTMARATPGR
jgi:ectoine hydroxylase-related dioxygenase (phytanoyl-CoA dioxygenase family)